MITFSTEVRVKYGDTDKMQFAHHSKYIEYFEVARTEMLRYFGLPYKEIEDRGYALPVMEVNIKYKGAAFYDDLLLVQAIVKEIPVSKVQVFYKIYKKETMQLCVEGFTTLMFIKTDSKKAVRPPNFYIDMIKKNFKDVADEITV